MKYLYSACTFQGTIRLQILSQAYLTLFKFDHMV